jgi:hypothetical protein
MRARAGTVEGICRGQISAGPIQHLYIFTIYETQTSRVACSVRIYSARPYPDGSCMCYLTLLGTKAQEAIGGYNIVEYGFIQHVTELIVTLKGYSE